MSLFARPFSFRAATFVVALLAAIPFGIAPAIAGEAEEDVPVAKVPIPPDTPPASSFVDPWSLVFGTLAPPNVNVSRASGNQSEITTAINPTNPLNIVVMSNTNSNSAFRGYSLNGGATWTTGNVFANASCCDAQAVFDSFGNLFVVYISNTYDRIQVALSTDGGATFPTIQTVGTGSVDQPSIAVGPGSVWVDWNLSGSMKAAGAPVTGLGAWGTFGATQSIPSATGSFGGIAAVGPSGAVMVAYQNPTSGEGPASIYANVDPDGLGPLGFGSRVTVTSTNVGGFDYIPCQSSRSVDAEAGIAWDATGGPFNGRVYLVYTDEATNESNDTNVMLRWSDNSGATWSAPVKVNDDATTRSQFLPSVSIDRTVGVVAVGFYDARNDGGVVGSGSTNTTPNDDAMYYAAFSCDGGATFRPNVQMSAGVSNAARAGSGVDYGDYVNSDFLGESYRAAWADNSNSTADNPAGTLTSFDLYSAGATFSCAFVGDRAWFDANANGIQDAGETGIAGAAVSIRTAAGALVGSSTSSATGAFAVSGLSWGSSYYLDVAPPAGYQVTLKDQGSDDTADSDVDPSTHRSATFPLAFGPDTSRWDVGLLPCTTPDQAPLLGRIAKASKLGGPQLSFSDANSAVRVTGWNVYTSTISNGGWARLATNVADQDAASAGVQWVDSISSSPDVYYDVVAWNGQCSTEGPH